MLKFNIKRKGMGYSHTQFLLYKVLYIYLLIYKTLKEEIFMSDVIKEVSTVTIGGKFYDADSVTPSVYFDYVKSLKKTLEKKEWEVIINQALIMLEKAKITGQTSMAAKLTHEVELAIRELEAADQGFNIFVDRKDIERYIKSVEGKSVKIMNISNYTRDIPDDVVPKLIKAKELFDEVYIIFTDYTLKETKKVAKERRDKDPILFGAFKDTTDNDKSNSGSKIYIEDRLFFIADWVEEKCDLTLEQIVRDVKDKDNIDITYKIETPEDLDAAKNLLKSYEEEKIESIKPVSLFDKVKETVKKTTKRRGRPPKKKKDDDNK